MGIFRIIHAYGIKRYAHTIHAYEFTIYDILVFKQVIRNRILIQAENGLKYGMIYIFKDEFKYVIGMAG